MSATHTSEASITPPVNSPLSRERPEPHEGLHPLHPVMLVFMGAMVMWGAFYFWLYGRDLDVKGGDQRTPIVAAPATFDGAAVFASRCASCHQANGQGLPGAFPPLAGSPYVTHASAPIVDILLRGLDGPVTVGGQPFNGVMPSFATASDAELAAVISYVRGAFGNAADAVDEATVAHARERLGAGPALKATAFTVE